MKKKKREWAKYWQCDSEVQSMEDKPWRNEEFKKLGRRAAKAESRESRKKPARSYKGYCGWGLSSSFRVGKRNKGEFM